MRESRPDEDGAPEAAEETESSAMRPAYRAAFIVGVIALALVPLAGAAIGEFGPAFTKTAATQETAAPATMIAWNAAKDGSPKTYVIDGYRLTLSARGVAGKDQIPLLHVKAPTGEEYDVAGQEGFADARAEFGAGKLDPTNANDQVIFTTYSGGAHCCTSIDLLVLDKGKWKTAGLGEWDGDGLGDFPTDVDGDGVRDIVLRDDRFAYAFEAYAFSWKPPRIFELCDGRARDVSDASRYLRIFENDMVDAETRCLEHSNGACAGYVADAARLGRFDEAWRTMLGVYKRGNDWDYPTKCDVALVADVCPQGHAQQFSEFPDALKWFLADKGYIKN